MGFELPSKSIHAAFQLGIDFDRLTIFVTASGLQRHCICVDLFDRRDAFDAASVGIDHIARATTLLGPLHLLAPTVVYSTCQ